MKKILILAFAIGVALLAGAATVQAETTSAWCENYNYDLGGYPVVAPGCTSVAAQETPPGFHLVISSVEASTVHEKINDNPPPAYINVAEFNWAADKKTTMTYRGETVTLSEMTGYAFPGNANQYQAPAPFQQYTLTSGKVTFKYHVATDNQTLGNAVWYWGSATYVNEDVPEIPAGAVIPLLSLVGVGMIWLRKKAGK
jgi:hypothetical protein